MVGLEKSIGVTVVPNATLDFNKITCGTWLGYGPEDRDFVRYFMSGYYNAAASNSVLDCDRLQRNSKRPSSALGDGASAVASARTGGRHQRARSSYSLKSKLCLGSLLPCNGPLSDRDPARAVDAADTAALLSPLDPMLFAIYGARTFALLRLGEIEEAAEFSVLGAEQPNAHVHARAIAVLTLATAGRMDEAQAEWQRIRALRPDYNFRKFSEAFHLVDNLKRIYQKAARLAQMPEC